MKNLLQSHGIKVINNKIAKADVKKAINIIVSSNSEPTRDDCMNAFWNADEATLRKIAEDQEIEDDVSWGSIESAKIDIWEMVFKFYYASGDCKELTKLCNSYDLL